jgi:hypothetical protein
MSCECTKVKAIRQCGGFVEIGAMEGSNTQYFIYIKDVTVDVIWRVLCTSDASGFIEFDMDDRPRFFQPNHTYEVWAHVTTATNDEQQDPITITIGSALYEYDCFQFQVIKLTDDESKTIAYTPLQVLMPQ